MLATAGPGVNDLRMPRPMSSGDPHHHDDDHNLAVETSKPELAKPPMYKVFLLNDDYTPMEFVVHILEQFFNMDRHRATSYNFV